MGGNVAGDDWRSKVVAFLGVDGAQLEALSGGLDDASCWFTGAELPGTAVIQLPMPGPRTTAYLSRAGPGTVLPLHRHHAREGVLVLRGGFRETNGRAVRPGEIMVSEIGTAHEVRVDANGDCICAIRMDFDADVPQPDPLDRGIELVRR